MSASRPSSPAAAPDIGQWQAAGERARVAHPELDWLGAERDAALGRVLSRGLPDTRVEDWRYTSLAEFSARSAQYLAAVEVAEAPTAGQAPGQPLVTAGDTADAAVLSIEIVNGLLRTPVVATPPGLAVHSLRHATPALQSQGEALLRAAAAAESDTVPNLVDLNMALLRDVVLITVAAGARIAQPVHVTLRSSTPRWLAQPRLLVDLGATSSLTLILEHTGAEGALCNAVTQIELAGQARFELIRIQALPDDGMLTENTRLNLAAGAQAVVTSVDLGSRLSRQDLNVILTGQGAEATVHGVFLADGRRHIDNHTRLEHSAPQTVSREYIRGIADDHGHGVFNGKIIVQPGAAGSNAALTNRNLLLTTTAELDTKPELEIYADDVRCSHGATTGQLDANALFYLRSRGLDAAAARQVLTTAFLRQGLNGISLPALRARLDAQLQARLRGPGAAPGGPA